MVWREGAWYVLGPLVRTRQAHSTCTPLQTDPHTHHISPLTHKTQSPSPLRTYRNISHNFGAFLAPLLAGTAALKFGWRYGVWAPAMIALTISSFVIAIVRDSPESLDCVDAESAWAMKEAKEAAEEVESSEEEGWMKAMEEEAAASDSSVQARAAGRGGRCRGG